MTVIEGCAGKAMPIALPAVPPKDHLAMATTLAAWVIDAPGQAVWRHYELGVIVLLPIPGVKPAHIKVPGATHEVTLFALDPAPGPRADDIETLYPLLPVNVEYQFAGLTDLEAIWLGGCAVQQIVSGNLAAEPDGIASKQLWHTSLDALRAEILAGRHAGDV